MRKIMLFIFMFAMVCAYGTCEDNILAVNTDYNKKTAALMDKFIQKDEDRSKVITPEDQALQDDSDKELEKMRSYRMLIQGRQKDLDLIKLDLEKSSLLLKEKEDQEKIYQIDKALPSLSNKEGSATGKSTMEGLKEDAIDSSDIKIQLLAIADGFREGQINLKNTLYSFKEGDMIASKFRVEKIEAEGITLREPDGTALKVNFTD